ncbi:hypothetical protein L1049_014644 [Liquidambar formosana]|uniref:Uncharacterized protein n=1 Tax=Liquidambar formosana TaxID=63359 RepID=A0AAP0RWV9_LIQFO
MNDNLFSGPIPVDIAERLPLLRNLEIKGNSLNGTIPSSIGKLIGLEVLVISNGHISGTIPDCWNDLSHLFILDVSNNSLSGEIPSSFGSLRSLKFLWLSNNKLSGDFPSALQNCTSIETLDLGGNKLSGKIPLWIAERMPSLLILSLRSNLFEGSIPSQLCSLSSLHILDLAHNNLSGSIPLCMGNLSGMASDLSNERYEGQLWVVVKGRQWLYENILYLLNSIDLSSNNLSGELPEGLSNLSRLGTLNFSMNHLTGEIPQDIGSLQRLETLDLSMNQISGPIPPSLTSLTSLNHLNLSYNNLTGEIPLGNQFLTLDDASIYMGNPALCGFPLTIKCNRDDETPQSPEENKDDEDGGEFEMMWFYISMGPGFVVGFWGVCGTLIIKKSWRYAYFRFVDDMKERIFVVVLVKLAHLRRRMKARKELRYNMTTFFFFFFFLFNQTACMVNTLFLTFFLS